MHVHFNKGHYIVYYSESAVDVDLSQLLIGHCMSNARMCIQA